MSNIYICVCVCVCMHVHVFMHACMLACMLASVCVCELCQSSIHVYAHCGACSVYFQYPNIMLIFYLAMPLNIFCQLLHEKCEVKLTASVKRKDGDTQRVKNKTFVHIGDNLLL